MSLAVEFRALCKSFGAVEVLHAVDFAISPGSVVGLIGENGAGKSTLVKIFSGYEQATSGDFTLDGQPQRFSSSRAAERCGVVLIHQEFNLAEHLSIAMSEESESSLESLLKKADTALYEAKRKGRNRIEGYAP